MSRVWVHCHTAPDHALQPGHESLQLFMLETQRAPPTSLLPPTDPRSRTRQPSSVTCCREIHHNTLYASTPDGSRLTRAGRHLPPTSTVADLSREPSGGRLSSETSRMNSTMSIGRGSTIYRISSQLRRQTDLPEIVFPSLESPGGPMLCPHTTPA